MIGQITVGRRYAYREKPKAWGKPFLPVEVCKNGPGKGTAKKVKVRLLAGEYEGLELWVPQLRLVVPWDEAADLIKDEQNQLACSAECTPIDKSAPLYWACWTIFEAMGTLTGEELITFGLQAYERNMLVIEDFATAVARCNLDAKWLKERPFAYFDRHGVYRAPTAVAEEVARRFAKEHTAVVTHTLETEENEHRAELMLAGDEHEQQYAMKALNDFQLVSAMVREWCGVPLSHYDELETLKAEVLRLRGIIQEIILECEDAGEKRQARNLSGKLNGDYRISGFALQHKKRLLRMYERQYWAR